MDEKLANRLRDGDDLRDRIEAADLIERAYGLLWRDLQGGPITSRAREMLLSAIDKDGQARGIEFAQEKFGAVSDEEALRYLP